MSAEQSPFRITVLISGSGTNLQALIDAVASKKLVAADPSRPIRFVRVISNRKSAFGLTRAETAGIPIAYHNLVTYKRKHDNDVVKAREEYDSELARLVLADSPHLVVCAGFMHILSPRFLEPVAASVVPIINLHPALYGRFNGAGAIQRAHQAFMEGKITETGVMIHYVIAEVDMGQPLLEVPVPLTHPEDDDIEALEARIHAVEHKAIVEGAQMAIRNLSNTSSQ